MIYPHSDRGQLGFSSQIYRHWVPSVMMVACIGKILYSPPISFHCHMTLLTVETIFWSCEDWGRKTSGYSIGIRYGIFRIS
jgi:hypothetical protein